MAARSHSLRASKCVTGEAISETAGSTRAVRPSAVAVSEESQTIEEVYEPYLIQQGYLKRTPRGREATLLAYEHFGLHHRKNVNKQRNLFSKK